GRLALVAGDGTPDLGEATGDRQVLHEEEALADRELDARGGGVDLPGRRRRRGGGGGLDYCLHRRAPEGLLVAAARETMLRRMPPGRPCRGALEVDWCRRSQEGSIGVWVAHSGCGPNHPAPATS